MKDAYSFHADEASLDATYQDMYQAYGRIFKRVGINVRPVLADSYWWQSYPRIYGTK